jgi:hypothetical protein
MDDQLRNDGVNLVIGGNNNGNIAIGQGNTQVNHIGNRLAFDHSDVLPVAVPDIAPAGIGRTQQQRLFQVLSDYFSSGELRDLCFELAIAYDDLPGERHRDKARELVAYAGRHERLTELAEAVRRARPHAFVASS